MPKAKSNGIEIYFEEYGKGYPLILISGLASDHTCWSQIIDVLAKDFKVIVFDNRGIGETTVSDASCSIDVLANDTIGLLDALNIEKANIMGQSMGGAIAQTIAINYPGRVNKLVLSASFYQIKPGPKYTFETVLKLFEEEVNPAFIGDVIIPWTFSNTFLSDQKNINRIIDRNKKRPTQSLLGYKKQYEALVSFNSFANLKKIKSPTLVIGAEEDVIVPIGDTEKLAKNIPFAKLEILPLTGHSVWFEAPKKLSEIVLEFLKE